MQRLGLVVVLLSALGLVTGCNCATPPINSDGGQGGGTGGEGVGAGRQGRLGGRLFQARPVGVRP